MLAALADPKNVHTQPNTAGYVDKYFGEWPLLRSPAWCQVREDGFVPDLPDADRLLVTLRLWNARGGELRETSATLGLILESGDDAARLAADVHAFALIVLPFTGDVAERIQRLVLEHGYRGVVVALLDDSSAARITLRAQGYAAFARRAARASGLHEAIVLESSTP